MRILILNTYDLDGGAAAAAYRLHKGLQNSQSGVEVNMLVAGKRRDDDSVISLSAASSLKMRAFMIAEFTPARLYTKRDRVSLFSPGMVSTPNVLQTIKALDPDIVHLHWLSGGFISINDIGKIGRPVVWTMHDMWPFTGGCHYDKYCGRYLNSCGSCPNLASKRDSDISRWGFKQKEKAYSRLPSLTMVGPSRWITEEAKKSGLAHTYEAVNLPNPIDTKEFYPEDRLEARQKLNLPVDCKLVLFGAFSATSDPRKGFDLASAALTRLEQEVSRDGQSLELVVMGAEPPEDKPNFPFETHYTGWIRDIDKMRTLYSAADVFLSPSRQENLSNMIVESMACGTPVVSFDIGGNRDMIDHKENGYLAKAFDTDDLAEGLAWVVNHKQETQVSQNAINKIFHQFSEKVVIPRYLSLYKQILEHSNQLIR